MPRRGPVELAVARTLRGIEHPEPPSGSPGGTPPKVQHHPAHEGLAASALVLARALDGDAGLATAAVARELRATLAALTEAGGRDDGTDPLAGLTAVLSSPVEYAPLS